MTSQSLFMALFDEFKAVPQPKIQAFLKIASNRLGKQAWGETYDTGVCYLAAHMLVSAGGNAGTQTGAGGATAGPLTEVSVGDLSKSFGQMADTGTSDDLLKTTGYGRMFLELRRETIIGFGVTGCPSPPAGTVIC